MCCPVCPSRDSIKTIDHIFITIDGFFSIKYKSKASHLDRINVVSTAENAWVFTNEDASSAAVNGASIISKRYPVKRLFVASFARHDIALKMTDMIVIMGKTKFLAIFLDFSFLLNISREQILYQRPC
ncbi:uncharacterized protein EV154DRAFT_553730 [Mucor mucedo]|uniref:uncharacterized protein n=1 Tax=Mucor mucedo TaxID=29922 RepID=UPI0022206CA9|nr:uncharacterized protein EV154DRAFT_553730 [Mucor mucedo]KAI7888625.1 hypothetical protein EV154DRAFT_553730 [Mucor mucedo]